MLPRFMSDLQFECPIYNQIGAFEWTDQRLHEDGDENMAIAEAVSPKAIDERFGFDRGSVLMLSLQTFLQLRHRRATQTILTNYTSQKSKARQKDVPLQPLEMIHKEQQTK